MRILLVEDEHRIAHAIKKGLEIESYAVDVVYTGNEGYDLASTEEYDVIILDLMLPGMDGVTVCKTLRKEKVHTPILMLTAKGQVEDKVHGLNAGADDYLPKPFAFEELLARIRALSRRPQHALPTVLTVRNLTLSASEFVVQKNGNPIQLSQKEFSLLEYLMRNAGKIVTKDQIIAHVWSYDADILPNTVEVYIRNLRLKIDHSFPQDNPFIHTIRGFGYKLE